MTTHSGNTCRTKKQLKDYPANTFTTVESANDAVCNRCISGFAELYELADTTFGQSHQKRAKRWVYQQIHASQLAFDVKDQFMNYVIETMKNSALKPQIDYLAQHDILCATLAGIWKLGRELAVRDGHIAIKFEYEIEGKCKLCANQCET